jgi:hypothetical protein
MLLDSADDRFEFQAGLVRVRLFRKFHYRA